MVVVVVVVVVVWVRIKLYTLIKYLYNMFCLFQPLTRTLYIKKLS